MFRVGLCCVLVGASPASFSLLVFVRVICHDSLCTLCTKLVSQVGRSDFLVMFSLTNLFVLAYLLQIVKLHLQSSSTYLLCSFILDVIMLINHVNNRLRFR